ncbi:MAG: hypothetical protein LBC85_00680 [Fibromonadaceae bacterium]|jgi:hypothetical protein|nr:hypothetical protein [Fibromonadaceae bacterium]
MKKITAILLLLPALLFAEVWDGTATDDTWYTSDTLAFDYTISTAAELAGLAQLSNNLDAPVNFFGKTITLAGNIDLGSNGWTPINNFRGTFDGGGHVISGVSINFGLNLGLFGTVNNGALIMNLGVVVDIEGEVNVGGLVGNNQGTIRNSYATGSVKGTFFVGGLVGSNSGTIRNSYVAVEVEGNDFVGGLVGSNQLLLGKVSNSYYNSTETSVNNGIGFPKTTEEMQSQAFVDTLNIAAGFLSANKWVYTANEYPKLSNETAISIDITDFFDSGDGEEASPYIIKNPEQLKNFSSLVNLGSSFYDKHIELGNNINLESEANQWIAIGTDLERFEGTFDGDGHVISGVYINNSKDYQGLFGMVGASGTIKNLGLISLNIEGKDNVGGLAGFNGGAISNSYVIGDVKGKDYVGGLAGRNCNVVASSGGPSFTDRGTVEYSYATANVEGIRYVGGLVGQNCDIISNSYVMGKIEGDDTTTVKGGFNVGGLAGDNSGSSMTIINSYSTARVEREGGSVFSIGGLAGSSYGTIHSSYYDRQRSGQNDAGKGTLRTTAQMQNKDTYNGWDFEDVWQIDPFNNNAMPYLQWQNEMKDVEVAQIEPQLYTGYQIRPEPEITGIPSEDFEYHYGENIHVATGGIVYIVAPGKFGSKILEFVIKPARIIDITWIGCGNIFTYNGEPQSPTPSAEGYELEIEGAQINAGNSLLATAKLKTPAEDVLLRNASCLYAIAPKELLVTWTGPREYVYNKMAQCPVPSIDKNNLADRDDDLDLALPNCHSGAGVYEGDLALIYSINPSDPNVNNYRLLNNRAGYTIHKKDLIPYFFPDGKPDFETSGDTLRLPEDYLLDENALRNVLMGLIAYFGFATDNDGNSDDGDVLSGDPSLEFTFSGPQNNSPFLSRRVDTQQKATAIINTENVTAENYALVRPTIIIIGTEEESADTKRVSCYRGNHCSILSEAVCTAIQGKEVPSCSELRVDCEIGNVTIEGMLFSECASMGGITPILPNRGSSSPARSSVQTIYYDLKGAPLGTTKPTAPGVYIEKRGKYARKIAVH